MFLRQNLLQYHTFIKVLKASHKTYYLDFLTDFDYVSIQF